MLTDARHLNLVRRMPGLRPGVSARSLYWHQVEQRPCLCPTLHNHCYAVGCPCERHEGEISAS